jgi:lysyl-tRNA synthetase class 2
MEPTLEAIPGGEAWLHTSPEFALKRAVAAGLHRVYALTPCFRAEEWGPHHGSEFTMLELYLANAGYLELAAFVERLLRHAWAAVGGSLPTFACVSVAQLYGGAVPEDDETFFRRWVDEIDPTLTSPTFVVDYPSRHAGLAEIRGEVAERVEVYVGGLELGNGYSELRDGEELRRRFLASASTRRAAGRLPYPTDEGVIEATTRLPRCAGIALGVDRMVMAILGVGDIRGVRVPR